MREKSRYSLAVIGLFIMALVLLVGCSEHPESVSTRQVIDDVSFEEAFALMEDNRGNTGFVIIDLRPADEYAAGHIEDAINLDCTSSNFTDVLNSLEREGVYLLYSRTDHISGRVLNAMAELGFSEVYNMLGGMEKWEKVGLPKVP